MITLKTIEQASAQSVFDQAVNHLRKQGRKSQRPVTVDEKAQLSEEFAQLSEEFICLYRGPEGTACAAGCFISDEEYRPELEGAIWNAQVGLRPNYAWKETGLPAGDTHHNLIRDLQIIHDCRNISEWEDGFKRLAFNHGLKYTEPQPAEV